MKKILYILSAITIITGCTDLDLGPEDAAADAEVFQDPAAYKAYLAKLYGAFTLTGQDGPAGDADISIVNDEGFTSYIRVYWKAQELTTDEAVVGWSDAGIRDLHEHTWGSENQFVRVLYYRIFYIIAYANDFLTQSTPSKLDQYGIPESERADIARFRAEARFLRAMAYWHALDFFQNVPLLTTISTELPAQATPQQIFEFIETELNEIEPDMADPMQNEYGRADKAALWMLQAKLYLNAEVYINESRYTETITACNKVIGGGYTLHNNYKELWMADNEQLATSEIIFALNHDGDNTQTWGGTTFLVHAALGGVMSDNFVDGTEDTTQDPFPEECLTRYGVGGGWEGLRTTHAMVAKFGDTLDIANMDPRHAFEPYNHTAGINNIATFTHGYPVTKWSNLTSAGERGKDADFVDTDYPMFRLADAYLMYAEAVLRGGTGGDAGTALGYINDLRERAFGDTSGNIVSGDLTLDFILDERVRELYWEGTRRIDLIRYNQFTEYGVWPWKGGVKEGTTTSSHLNIFPIPASDLNVNPLLQQNDNY